MSIRRWGLISDTHGQVHRRVHELLGGVEMILHAGDVGEPGILDELGLIAPVLAVAGNVDYVTPVMPLRRTVELPFGKVGIAHGHLFPSGPRERSEALLAAFAAEAPRVILYGHSHIALEELRGETMVLNPGSAGPPRFRSRPSLAILEWNPAKDELRFNLSMFDWQG